MEFKNLLQGSFTFSTIIIFLISAFYLLFIDCKDYKKKGFIKEYKVCKFFGIFFIVFSISMFVLMRFVFK